MNHYPAYLRIYEQCMGLDLDMLWEVFDRKMSAYLDGPAGRWTLEYWHLAAAKAALNERGHEREAERRYDERRAEWERRRAVTT